MSRVPRAAPARVRDARYGVVVLTWNRRAEVLRTLARLTALALDVPIAVVDNASADGTAEAIARRFPGVTLIRMPRNVGAAARNAGVEAIDRPYVAFCDDDTWWQPGSLARAADVLDAFPSLAVVTGRVLVGRRGREDPTCARMAGSPFPNALGVPGAAIFGFLAGACMMRCEAYRAVGGFDPRFLIGGEEGLLAIDLMASGWHMAYAPAVTVCHHPSRIRDPAARRHLTLRNRLWIAWLRRPWRDALALTVRTLRGVPDAPAILGAALRGLPWVLRERRVAPRPVQETLHVLDAFVAEQPRGAAATGKPGAAPQGGGAMPLSMGAVAAPLLSVAPADAPRRTRS